MGTLNPRSRCPLRIFMGALSTTFLPIAARIWAELTMPAGWLRREKMPPSSAVTTRASLPSLRIAAAPFSTRSPRSIRGTERITSATRVSARCANAGITVSRPTVPRISSLRVTRSGTGCCTRRCSSTSARVSSGSHSAPRTSATASSSGMRRLLARQHRRGARGGLPRREHADGCLVLVHHNRETALVVCHERDDLAGALVLVDQQRWLTQHVTGKHVGGRWPHGEVTAGHHDVTRDKPVEDVLLLHVADRTPVEKHNDLRQGVVREQLGDRVDGRARQTEHHVVAHDISNDRVAGVGREGVWIDG